jgi:hypothetical protein
VVSLETETEVADCGSGEQRKSSEAGAVESNVVSLQINTAGIHKS